MKPKRVVTEEKVPVSTKEIAPPVRGTYNTTLVDVLCVLSVRRKKIIFGLCVKFFYGEGETYAFFCTNDYVP